MMLRTANVTGKCNVLDNIMETIEAFAIESEANLRNSLKEITAMEAENDKLKLHAIPRMVLEKLKTGDEIQSKLYDSQSVLALRVGVSRICLFAGADKVVKLLNEFLEVMDALTKQTDSVHRVEETTDSAIFVAGLEKPRPANDLEILIKTGLFLQSKFTEKSNQILQKDCIQNSIPLCSVVVHSGALLCGLAHYGDVSKFLMYGETVDVVRQMTSMLPPVDGKLLITEVALKKVNSPQLGSPLSSEPAEYNIMVFNILFFSHPNDYNS